MTRNSLLIAAAFIALGLLALPAAWGGMPAPLPSGWTAGNTPPGHAQSGSADAQWQAISFFVACLLLSAWVVQRLWNSVGKDFARLPRIGYRRALSFVILWGLLFVILLTMISGARELMTPGAWQKQGWTYRLAGAAPEHRGGEVRWRALDRLQVALMQYARGHDGHFPPERDPEIDPQLWVIPGRYGLKFGYVPGRSIEVSGQILAYEPEWDGDERLVLFTTGTIGFQRTVDIETLLAAGPKE